MICLGRLGVGPRHVPQFFAGLLLVCLAHIPGGMCWSCLYFSVAAADRQPPTPQHFSVHCVLNNPCPESTLKDHYKRSLGGNFMPFVAFKGKFPTIYVLPSRSLAFAVGVARPAVAPLYPPRLCLLGVVLDFRVGGEQNVVQRRYGVLQCLNELWTQQTTPG